MVPEKPASLIPAAAPAAMPVSAVRSTLLLSSVAALRGAGYFERYVGALTSSTRDEILGTVAGVWLPVQTALLHYQACDALSLGEDEQLQLGRRTGAGLERHLTRAAGMLARGAGVTPLAMLEQFPRFWARSFLGGSVVFRRLGPKDAELSYLSCALVRSAYFRGALRGVAVGLLEVATRRCMMREVARYTGEDCAHYLVSWV